MMTVHENKVIKERTRLGSLGLNPTSYLKQGQYKQGKKKQQTLGGCFVSEVKSCDPYR